MSLLQFWMEVMKYYWLIGQMINTLSAMSIMTFQSKIPSHLCNCGIEADSHHLLESLTTCDSKQLKLIMYFTINLAFSNYLELMPSMTEHKILNRDKTLREQPLSVHLKYLML